MSKTSADLTMLYKVLLIISFLSLPCYGHVIGHGTMKSHTMNGNTITGVATPSMGAQEHEVWRSQIAPGGKTPLHRHTSEETFIVLKGEGYVLVGEEKIPFKAPTTIIAPKNVNHQVVNTGKEPTDSIVIVKVGSKIFTASGKELSLKWRK